MCKEALCGLWLPTNNLVIGMGGGRRVCMMREGYMYAHTQIKMHRIFIFLALVLLFHVAMRQPCNSQNAQPRVQQSLLVYYGPCTHVSIGDDN